MQPYTEQFYRTYADESVRSAREVVPQVIALLQPTSVVDVGCGIGTWLSVFHQHGVTEILGVDGSYVQLPQLLIPANRFVPHDLTKPLSLGDARFDLAVSLEVAEHLPEPRAAQFVAGLVALAPVVLFSAAIPHQGGDHHINEQWPTYWATLFERHGYRTVDWLRPRIWGNPNVAYYYAQNTLLFVDEHRLATLPELSGFVTAPSDPTLAKVHPAKWDEAHDPVRIPMQRILSILPAAVTSAVARRIRRHTSKW